MQYQIVEKASSLIKYAMDADIYVATQIDVFLMQMVVFPTQQVVFPTQMVVLLSYINVLLTS